jgi:hypothetical protein
MADIKKAFIIQKINDERQEIKKCIKCKRINQYSITDDGNRECKCRCGNYFWKHGITKNCECFYCLGIWKDDDFI